MYHKPVLLSESVEGLKINPEGIYVDVTFGGGGHSIKILEKLSSGKLFAFDQDMDVNQNLLMDRRFKLLHTNFRHIKQFMKVERVKEVDGLLADLGVSSHQFDVSERGFSTRLTGPLDMRMNQNQGISASEWVNTATQKEIDNILWTLGEERFSRKIAKAICISRAKKSIKTTKDLTDLISEIIPRRGRRHPATNTFRAIRMFINNELEVLRVGLEAAASILPAKVRRSSPANTA